MTKYFLDIIPGTLEIVKKDLIKSFPEINIVGERKNMITFESEDDEIDNFKILSALRIKKENSITRNLFRREWKVENSPAGINPSLAYILCLLANLKEDDILLDPFCGAGTIVLTAVTSFNIKKSIGSDKSEKAIRWSIENSKHANFDKKKLLLFQGDIKKINFEKESVNKIVTNPPFGIRVGDHDDNVKLYNALFSKISTFLSQKGLAIIYTQEKKLVEQNCNKFQLKILKELKVEQGGLIPSIYIIKKI